MPQNTFIITTKSVSGEVYVFDYIKHLVESPHGGCNPYLRLRGHNEEGFGLSWSKFKEGHLLSVSNEAQICLWDINATPKRKNLEPLRMFKVHKGVVEDVAWHIRDENLFGSVGEDKYFHIWDLCSQTLDKLDKSIVAHQRGVHIKYNFV